MPRPRHSLLQNLNRWDTCKLLPKWTSRAIYRSPRNLPNMLWLKTSCQNGNNFQRTGAHAMVLRPKPQHTAGLECLVLSSTITGGRCLSIKLVDLRMGKSMEKSIGAWSKFQVKAPSGLNDFSQIRQPTSLAIAPKKFMKLDSLIGLEFWRS